MTTTGKLPPPKKHFYTSRLRKNIKEDIIKLSEEFPSMYQEKYFQLTLSQIYEVLPRARKEREIYRKFIAAVESETDFEVVIL